MRNFTNGIVPLSLNYMFSKDDYQEVFSNIAKNITYSKISDEAISFDKIVIVSDGFNFKEIHHIIRDFSEDVAVLAVNGALRYWELMSADTSNNKSINGYVVNNPYTECLRYLPKSHMQYYPTCLSSSKTNYEFLNKYQGDVYVYEPSPEDNFGTGKKRKSAYYIDDYRNPVCAAIGLAYQFGVNKLMLLCCDDSFKNERDYAVQLENGLWSYPQHIRCQEITDANLYWLTHQEDVEVNVADYSSGPKCLNALYIKEKEEARRFFEDVLKEEEGVRNDK